MAKNERMCYKIAYDLLCSLVKDNGLDSREVSLVHGSVVPQAGPSKGKRSDHAWVIAGNTVHDNSIEKPIECSIDKYKILKPVANKKYSFDESNLELVKSGHYGPW